MGGKGFKWTSDEDGKLRRWAAEGMRVRHIALNAKHRTDDVRPWFGDSIGWYEGDTLVVETDHFPQAQAYNGAWKNLTVTERYYSAFSGAPREYINAAPLDPVVYIVSRWRLCFDHLYSEPDNQQNLREKRL